MPVAERLQPQTAEEYFELEEKSEEKHEYIMGEIVAMAGAMPNHNRITGNTFVSLHQKLNQTGCEAFNSDQRVQVVAMNIYTYPDISVFCETPQLSEGRLDTFINPALLIEVLSKSTEAYDRGQKFARYRLIPSLREYLLISSEEILVEKFSKESTFQWLMNDYRTLDQTIMLDTIGAEISVADIYRSIDFSQS